MTPVAAAWQTLLRQAEGQQNGDEEEPDSNRNPALSNRLQVLVGVRLSLTIAGDRPPARS